MDKEAKQLIDAEIIEMTKLFMAKIDNLHDAMMARIDNFKKVIGEYLELSSNLSIATVKANLKNV